MAAVARICAKTFPFFNSETAFTQYKLSASTQVCFVCNTIRKNDSKSYLLGNWMEDKAAARLQECLVLGQDTERSRFKLANNRRRVLMAVVRDIFAAYISYQKTVIILIWPKLENQCYSQEDIKILKEQKKCDVRNVCNEKMFGIIP